MDKLQAHEMKSCRRMLRIKWQEKKTNDFVWNKVTEILGERPESVVETVKRRKLKYYGHQMRKQTAMAKTLIEGKVEGSRGRGKPRRQWEDGLKQWTGEGVEQLKRKAMGRERRKNVRDWVHSLST